MLLLKSVLVIAAFGVSGDIEYNLPIVNGKLQAEQNFVYNSPLACSRALAKALNEGFQAGCYSVDASGFVIDNPPINGVTISRGGLDQTRQPDSVIELRVTE